ncbi:MAG: alpha/beta hydrolase [Bryobacteraceae bacterium]|jgi:pimeloyl-ACP methyl ester carboxylesterase
MTTRLLFILALSGVFAEVVTAQTKPARTRDVVVRDGVTIDLIAEGRGPLIVLLPSLGRDSEEFDPVAAQIAAAGFRVLRPQPRGFGRSAGPMENLTLHDYARDVATAIEHENAGPAIVAGHAFGHFVAKMTAVDYPKLVRAVVLVAAAQKKADPVVRSWLNIATDNSQPESKRVEYLQKVFFAPGHDPRIWLTGFHPTVQRGEENARDTTAQKEYWSAGSAPLLDIQAEYDPFRPRSTSDELVQEFGAKRVSVVVIPNASHALPLEQPKAVSDAIVSYARRLHAAS